MGPIKIRISILGTWGFVLFNICTNHMDIEPVDRLDHLVMAIQLPSQKMKVTLLFVAYTTETSIA